MIGAALDKACAEAICDFFTIELVTAMPATIMPTMMITTETSTREKAEDFFMVQNFESKR